MNRPLAELLAEIINDSGERTAEVREADTMPGHYGIITDATPGDMLGILLRSVHTIVDDDRSDLIPERIEDRNLGLRTVYY